MLTGPNSQISGLVDKAGVKIASAIQKASAKTGVDFSYLLQQAQIESSFKADAKACTSSATGLYQFLDKTWLSMVDKYGDKYGISDSLTKKQVLDLRKNPEMCSLMAAEFASDNKDYLEKCTGQDIGSTELYLAHFMGAGGAGKFLKALAHNPDANGARLFPSAAAANKNVFYDKAGHARSLADVYAFFDKKFSIKDDNDTACPTTAMDSSVANVLAAMTPPTQQITPLYTNTTSLFTDREGTTDVSSPVFPHSFLSMISPVDVLELIKDQFTSHKANS